MQRSPRRQPKVNDDDRAKEMLTMRDACQLLNVHSNTLRRWSNQGTIQTFYIGVAGQRRFRREDIAALLEDRTGDKRHTAVK